jgi:tRNA A-37 threonylcarbamoyl transferase component Bud32/tetratricopeptide (TPR) repeat protein/adenylylsulfate kinase-like enzyme
MALRDDIPRYEALDLLGEGALATVYKVRGRKDGAVRALKALKPEQAAAPRALERFADEYRILSALHHPCLPEVYDYGFVAGGTPFMVMEFLEGDPLDEYLRDNPADLWLLLFQMNEALAFIHEHNLLHLDLKPSNVLVRRTKIFGKEESPLAVLIDFGLSYRREVGGSVKLVGTPGYMAPEIVRGEENLTRAVDYYSLGVVMYELIEGQLPFRGSLHDILRAHLADPVLFERRKVEHAELQTWVEKLMSKEPLERLDAFQGFRRAVAARLGQSVEKLERVFALGYIDSLGLVGKEEVWEELRSWVSGVSSGLAARAERNALLAAPVDRAEGGPAVAAEETLKSASDVREASVSDVLKGSVSDLDQRIRQDLLSHAATHAPPRPADLIETVPRVLAVTGPPASGKSHVLEALNTELRARGVGVVSLGRDSDYRLLVGDSDQSEADRSRIADPSALVTDRFNAGWNELARLGAVSGVVVMVDDLASVSAEEKEFLEYLGKRAGHEVAERKEPGVFVVAVGREAEVKDTLQPVLLGDAALAALEVPSPGKSDAESIAGGFRGRLSGVNEEKSLAAFLQDNLQTSASLYQSLKHAVGEGFFGLRHGRWEFHEGRAKPLPRAEGVGAYYEAIVRDLAGPAREVIACLSCHPARLTVSQLSEVSGLSAAEIEEAVDALKPYRIVDAAEGAAGRSLDLISDQVRRSLGRALAKKDRERIHRRFVAYFGSRPEDTARYWELMSHHDEQLGLGREALIARIRAVALARRAMDVFALRRLCEGGVDYARRLKGAEWTARKWPVERFFLKQWIHAESRVSGYRNVVSVIEENLIRRKREVPISFLYEYAVALERVGRREDCERVLRDTERELASNKSETYHLLLLQHARLLYNAGLFSESLMKLDEVNPALLSLSSRARLLSIYILNYMPLGKEEECKRVLAEVARLPQEPELVDQLMRVEYTKIRRMLVAGTYTAARKLIRRGIRLAVQYKAYRSLCSMYFAASALNYEIGDYQRALRFLDKTIRLAKESGTKDQLYMYMLRYAYIYEKLGLFGNAIESAEHVARAVRNDTARQEQYFDSLIADFKNHLFLNCRSVSKMLPELVEVARRVQNQTRLAFYHQALGRYYSKNDEPDEALREFDTARRLFANSAMLDDLAGMEIETASLLVSRCRVDEANGLLEEAKVAVEAMESNELKAKYLAVELARLVKLGAGDEAIGQCMDRCEVIRPAVAEAGVALYLDAELFRSAVAVGEVVRAITVFDRYYNQIRHIVSNLPQKYVADFVSDPQLIKAIESYRRLKTQDPGQCSGR